MQASSRTGRDIADAGHADRVDERDCETAVLYLDVVVVAAISCCEFAADSGEDVGGGDDVLCEARSFDGRVRCYTDSFDSEEVVEIRVIFGLTHDGYFK